MFFIIIYYYFAERYKIRSTLECAVENKSGGLNEPRHEKSCLRVEGEGGTTRLYSNRAAQPQTLCRGLKFRI